MGNPGCCLFERVSLVWLLGCCGGSTVTLLREDEQRTFVVLLVVVFGVVFVLVVGFSRVRCLFVLLLVGSS